MMVTNRNVIIGFGLLCECAFSFSANLKGHHKLLSTSTETNAYVFMIISNTVTFIKERTVYTLI